MEYREPEPVFDWSALDKDTRSVVQATTSRLHELERRTGEAIIEIGRGLIDTKERLGFGLYLSWLESEFGWSQSTASRFVQVAEQFGKVPNLGNFAPSALYALASGTVPDTVRDEFIERAAAGETIRHQDVRERLRDPRHVKAAPPPRQRVADEAVETLVDEMDDGLVQAFGDGVVSAMKTPVLRTSMQTVAERLAAARYELSTIIRQDDLRDAIQKDAVSMAAVEGCLESAVALAADLRSFMGGSGVQLRRVS